MDPLLYYRRKFQKLRIDRAHGIAPHKPVLLLSIIQGFEDQTITSKKIFITPELVALFRTNWNALVHSKHECRFALPFYHLTSDGFWRIIPKPGYENALLFKNSMRYFSQLEIAVEYAEIDESLFEILKKAEGRTYLKKIIMETYFPEYGDFIKNRELDYLQELESRIIQENPSDYITEFRSLAFNLSPSELEEEIYLRGGAFKREIPRIYNNKCCISGFRVDSGFNISMVDACHIIPFSESFNDTISNGLALCPNLHRAFDRGLIGLDEQYRVLVSTKFIETPSLFSLNQFKGKYINLPSEYKFYPSLKNIQWHRENTFLG